MHEEELLAFAHEDEEPILRIRYVPSFAIGTHGTNMYVLVGKDSKNRFLKSEAFPLDKQSPAEAYLRVMRSEWEKRQLAKQLAAKAEAKPKKKP